MLAGDQDHEFADGAEQAIILAAAAIGQIPPKKDFTLGEKVVVKDDRGEGQHVLDIEFLLVGGRDVLHQKLVLGFDGGFFLLRDGGVPTVRTQLTPGRDLHLRALGGLEMTIVKLDFRSCRGVGGIVFAVERFCDVEGLRAHALAIHKNAKAA